MSEAITKDDLGKYVGGASAVVIIVLALLIYNAPAKSVYAGYSTTVTFTAVSIETQILTSTNYIVNTVVHTINSTTTSVSTFTTQIGTATVNRTVTQTVTSSQTFPTMVTVSGSVTLSQAISVYTPTQIRFVTGSATQTATITNGKYALTLTNGLNYQVSIDYSLGPASGSCIAGNLPLNAVGPITESWSC